MHEAALKVSPPDVIGDSDTILTVRDLRVYFRTRYGLGRAVDGVDFDLGRGETLGLVGESGSGKTITGLTVLGLNPKPASFVDGGEVVFLGEDLLTKTDDELRRYRGKHIAMVLQDPMAALNPVLSIGDQVGEPLRLHIKLRGSHLRSRVIQLLSEMRIPSAANRLRTYPHQYSGGMRQRVVGAIGISCNPDVLIADEPTTALDPTVQAAYLALLKQIQAKTNLAILFITHDFGVVAKMCDRVAVMYAGRIVESSPANVLFDTPAHPYTRALINSVPDITRGTVRLASIPGAPPSIYRRPSGCAFHPRCELYIRLGKPERCRSEDPVARSITQTQSAACHFAERIVENSPAPSGSTGEARRGS